MRRESHSKISDLRSGGKATVTLARVANKEHLRLMTDRQGSYFAEGEKASRGPGSANYHNGVAAKKAPCANLTLASGRIAPAPMVSRATERRTLVDSTMLGSRL
jgi:hypothetical protein